MTERTAEGSLRRDQRESVRRARTRSRQRRRNTATVAIATFVLLVAGAAGGTYAFLSAQQPVSGATIAAGTAALQINGQQSVELQTWTLAPARGDVKEFVVTNTGDVSMTLGATFTVASSTPFAANVRAKLTPLSAGQACTTALAGTPSTLAQLTLSDLVAISPGSAQRLCLELSLDPTTPVTQAGQSVAFTMTMTGVQRVN